MDLLEDSDRELRVRPENMPDVSSSQDTHRAGRVLDLPRAVVQGDKAKGGKGNERVLHEAVTMTDFGI